MKSANLFLDKPLYIFGLISLFFCEICFAQAEASLSRVVTPIIENGDQVVLAASFVYGTYDSQNTTVDDLSATYAGLPMEQRFGHPEFVLAKQFEYRQEQQAEALFNLWDSQSQANLRGGLEGLSQSIDKPMARQFTDSLSGVQLRSKSQFGPFSRLEYALTLDWPDKEPVQNVYQSYYLEEAERVYRTKLMTRTSLFGILTDLSTQGPNPPIQRQLSTLR